MKNIVQSQVDFSKYGELADIKEKMRVNVENRILILEKNKAYIDIMGKFYNNTEVWNYAYTKSQDLQREILKLEIEYDELKKEAEQYE